MDARPSQEGELVSELLEKPNEGSESNGEALPKKPKVDVSTLPTRQYLDQTVIPLLIKALNALDKKRPEDPIEWLGNYILQKSQYPSSGSSDEPSDHQTHQE